MDTTALPPLGASPDGDDRDDAGLIVEVLALVSTKWSVEILMSLAQAPRRHGELLRELGGSKKVVTQALRRLERDGLVRRDVFAEVPPRVEYSLTDLARSLVGSLEALREWGETNLEPVGSARAWADATEARKVRLAERAAEAADAPAGRS